MGTTTGLLDRVTIFDPVIFINGVDVGFISDKLTFEYNYTSARYESGLPKNLRKLVKTEEKAMIKLELMQSSLGNFQSAFNLPASSLVSTSIITAGGDSSIQELTDVKFQGTDDVGKLWEIHFYSAAITENGSYNIDQDYMKIPITIEAISSLSRARSDQLFNIKRQA